MTHYIHVDLAQVSRQEFVGYIREFDYHVTASTKQGVEYEAYRTIEECEGLKGFAIIWSDFT